MNMSPAGLPGLGIVILVVSGFLILVTPPAWQPLIYILALACASVVITVGLRSMLRPGNGEDVPSILPSSACIPPRRPLTPRSAALAFAVCAVVFSSLMIITLSGSLLNLDSTLGIVLTIGSYAILIAATVLGLVSLAARAVRHKKAGAA
jgi:hypothetical protein